MLREKKLVPKMRFSLFNDNYREYKLSELLSRYSENNKDEEFSIDEILSLSSQYGIVNRKELLEDTYSKVNHKNYLKTRLNDFVYGKSISASYPYGLFKANNYKDGLLSTLYFTFNVSEIVEPLYLDVYFSHFNRANNFLKKYVLVGDRYITADANYILSGKIFIPTITEQKKVVNFITSIDIQIQTLEKKKNLLKLYKKGVLQKIFKQELRFEDGSDKSFSNWKEKKLGDLIVEYKKKSTVNNQYPVLTSSKRGLMLQSEYYSDDNPISERDNLGFNILPEEYITYRSRSDNRSFNFNLNSLGFTGVISVYYPVFKVENCNNYFLITLLNYYKSKIGKYSVGTSQTVLSINELKKMKFFVPSLEEQNKIADFLSEIDKNITLVNNKIEHTKSYKKGLLQQMFA